MHETSQRDGHSKRSTTIVILGVVRPTSDQILRPRAEDHQRSSCQHFFQEDF